MNVERGRMLERRVLERENEREGIWEKNVERMLDRGVLERERNIVEERELGRVLERV